MMRRALTVAALVLLTAGVGSAGAQEGARVGLVMGYPAAVGLQWQASSRIAIRPEVNLGRSSSEGTSTGGSQGSSSSWSTGVGVSALVYLGGKDEGLRTYVSPRFGYTHNSSTSNSVPSPAASAYSSENTANTYAVAGSLGAEYTLGKRFAAFGEVGLSYAHQDSTGLQSTIGLSATGTSSASTVGVRSAVGVILFF